MNYAQLNQAWIIALSQAPSPYTVVPADYTTLLPLAIEFAEDRIYRDMVLLAARAQNTTLATTSGLRTLDMAAISCLVPEGFALISPEGTTNPATGTRVPFDVASLDTIDLLWPVEATTVAPGSADNYGRFWAMKDDHTLVMMPTPDGAYTAEVTGLFRPAQLSATNTQTYLSHIYPDLMFAAGMIWLSGALQRNYGAMAADPKQAMSWESSYQTVLANSIAEEQRRRAAGTGWSPNTPTPLATPSRT